ncbi:MAG: O-antigen ligase family protein [Terriglobales bacterium]
MHSTLSPKSLTVEPWIGPLAISAGAILVGVIAGQGLWMFLPVVALVPLFWNWPVEMALGGVALLLPFEGISVIGGGERGLMSLAFVISIWVVLVVGVVGRRLQRPSSATFWCFAFVGWTAASVSWAVRPDVSIAHLTTVIGLFLFFFVMSSFRVTSNEFKCLVILTVAGGVAAGLFSLYQFHNGVDLVSRDSVRATLSAGETYVNPNRFAVRLLLPLAFSIAGFLSARSRLVKFTALACCGLISLALLLIQSRGTLVAAGVAVAVFCVRLKVRRGLIPILLVAAAMIAATPTIISRFETNDRGAGRFDIWLVGLAALQHYPVAGAGLSNFPIVYNDFAGEARQLYMKQENDSHNIYIEVAVEEGMIGLLLLLMTVKAQFGLLSKSRKGLSSPSPMLVACEAGFCSILVAGIFGNVLWDKTFWLTWVLLVFAITLQVRGASPGGTAVLNDKIIKEAF